MWSKVKERKGLKKLRTPVQGEEQLNRLAETEVSILSEAFANHSAVCTEGGCLNKEQFKACLLSLSRNADLRISEEYVAFADELFNTFDTNNDGEVSAAEFLAGMSVVCEGTPQEKIGLSFRAYCSESNSKHPYITRADMYKMFKSAYLNMLLFAKAGEGEVSDEEMAEWRKKATVAARDACSTAFSEADVNKDNKIVYKEFEQWAMSHPVVSKALADGEELQIPVVFSA